MVVTLPVLEIRLMTIAGDFYCDTDISGTILCSSHCVFPYCHIALYFLLYKTHVCYSCACC